MVCDKEGGFKEDDFVVEFLGEVWKYLSRVSISSYTCMLHFVAK